MSEHFSVYSVTAGCILLATVLSGRATYRCNVLISFQVTISVLWSLMIAIHCWGEAIRVCRQDFGMINLSLPALAIITFWTLFIAAFAVCLVIISLFARRLPFSPAESHYDRLKSICACTVGIVVMLILTMNAVLLLPGDFSTPLPRTAFQIGRIPIQGYLRLSGNRSRPEDSPAGFADYLDRRLGNPFISSHK